MRFLSQAVVPIAAALRAGLTDGYKWHRAIWEAFPGRPEAVREFLFRADRRGRDFRVLLLSPEAPAPKGVLVWQTKQVGESLLAHDIYRFSLKANPTMRRKSDGRRLAIYDEPRLREWLMRKAAALGFTVKSETLIVGAPIAEMFVKDGRAGKHVTVDFKGVLQVQDRDVFIRTFQTGIGSAKGFGYGLLMLQPIRK